VTHRILIVEDDNELSALLRLMLRLSDWEISSACNGLQALERAETFRPDLVLLDIMLPGMDGIQVCQRLRAKPFMAQVPIVMLSVQRDPSIRAAAFAAGAVDYWAKPIMPQEFLTQIKRVLGED